MGPVEMLGSLADTMRFVSLDGGIVKSAQGVPVMTEKFVSEDPVRILLVPGAAPQVLPKEKAFFEAGKAAAQICAQGLYRLTFRGADRTSEGTQSDEQQKGTAHGDEARAGCKLAEESPPGSRR